MYRNNWKYSCLELQHMDLKNESGEIWFCFFFKWMEGEGFVFFYIVVSALVFIIYPEGKEACGRERLLGYG